MAGVAAVREVSGHEVRDLQRPQVRRHVRHALVRTVQRNRHIRASHLRRMRSRRGQRAREARQIVRNMPRWEPGLALPSKERGRVRVVAVDAEPALEGHLARAAEAVVVPGPGGGRVELAAARARADAQPPGEDCDDEPEPGDRGEGEGDVGGRAVGGGL